jgi:uncharacterized protein (TIGR03435 family)
MVRSRLLASVGIVAVVGGLAGARAAQTPPKPTAFDVVSIKRDLSESGASTIGFERGGRFAAANEPLVRLISVAYATAIDLPRTQIIGGPSWIDTDKFDVRAIGDENASRDQGIAMLRAALADRFTLAIHSEVRELPIYNLVKSRSDGPLGDALRPSDIDCAALKSRDATPPPPAPGQLPPCILGFGRSQLMARGLTVEQLSASSVARMVDRPVVDRTDLAGPYDWNVRWAGDNPSDLNLPATIFTALQEQLGLKLEPARGSVDVVVIDHVEHPTED